MQKLLQLACKQSPAVKYLELATKTPLLSDLPKIDAIERQMYENILKCKNE